MKYFKYVFLIVIIFIINLYPYTTTELQNMGYVSVKQYGAKGDGETDDTDALKATITAAVSGTDGGTIYIPTGKYVISDSLVIAFA